MGKPLSARGTSWRNGLGSGTLRDSAKQFGASLDLLTQLGYHWNILPGGRRLAPFPAHGRDAGATVVACPSRLRPHIAHERSSNTIKGLHPLSKAHWRREASVCQQGWRMKKAWA